MSLFFTLVFYLALVELSARLGRTLKPEGTLSLRWSQGLAASTLLFACAALLLSSVGWLRPAQIRLATGCCLALLFKSQALRDVRSLRLSQGLLIGLLGCLFGLSALAPNTEWDAQVYHYTLPSLYLEHGGVYWTNTGIYDSLWSLSHPLNAWALGCGGELSANLLGAVFLALLLCSLLALSQPGTDAYVLALGLSSPILIVGSTGGATDLPAAAYIAAMMAAGDSRLGPGWGLAAVLTRLNALPALFLWGLQTSNKKKILMFSLAGLAPWMVFNGLHLGDPLFPFSTLWRGSDFRGSLSHGANQLLLSQWRIGLDSRAWMSLLSPLLLPGLLLFRRKNWEPWLIFGLTGLALSALLRLSQARYQLAWTVGLLLWSGTGWHQQGRTKKWLRVTFWTSTLVCAIVSFSALAPKLLFTLTRQSEESYLSSRLTSWPAYRWLEKSHYKKVLLTDPRAYRCPKPFALVDQASLGDLSYPGVAQHFRDQQCQAIVWNFEYPRVARAALWQAAVLAHGDRSAISKQLLGRLGSEWIGNHLRQWPEFADPAAVPPDNDPVMHQLRVLYFLSAHSRPVFQSGLVLITEWPLEDNTAPYKILPGRGCVPEYHHSDP